MRRLVTVGLIVVILAAIWSGGWFALAAWAEGKVAGGLAQIEERGVTVACSDRDIVGFPFALRLACGPTDVAARGGAAKAQLAGLTGGASVFAPRTARVALASPARVQAAAFVTPAELSWSDAVVDVAMSLGGPQAVSFETQTLRASLPVAEVPDAQAAATTASGTLAPANGGGTDAAVRFTGLELSGAGKAFPPFDGRASAWISAAPRALLAGRAGLQAPLSARAVDVLLSSGAAKLQVQGDLSIDAEGIADGVLALRIAGTEALPDFIAALPADQQRIGNAVAAGMLAFGRPATIDGEAASELTVEIERGRARIGPLTVGVPRVPL